MIFEMAESTSNLLLSTAQNEFKEDILKSLLLDDNINVNVRQSLEKLSNKWNFKLEELRNDWLNRGGPDYLTIRQVIENNVQFRAEQNQIIEEKNDRLISLSEKNLQIVWMVLHLVTIQELKNLTSTWCLISVCQQLLID